MASKGKKRYHEDGFDLDLSYITPRIIAMGYPSMEIDDTGRSLASEMQRFFTHKHCGHYKIYNLCSEWLCALEDGLFESVERFPIDDNDPCALKIIESFCLNIHEYLNSNPYNVVSILCRTGKGRAGLMISTYLMYSGLCKSAHSAMTLFNSHRMNNKQGLIIPSQKRYLFYFEQMLKNDNLLFYSYQITSIRIITIPNFDQSVTGGDCNPFIIIRNRMESKAKNNIHDWPCKTVFNQLKDSKVPLRKYHPHDKHMDFDLYDSDVKVRGDIQISIFHKDTASTEKMCQIWFHSGFIEHNHNYLVFEKNAIDIAFKDKNHRLFDSKFRIEILLHRIPYFENNDEKSNSTNTTTTDNNNNNNDDNSNNLNSQNMLLDKNTRRSSFDNDDYIDFQEDFQFGNGSGLSSGNTSICSDMSDATSVTTTAQSPDNNNNNDSFLS